MRDDRQTASAAEHSARSIKSKKREEQEKREQQALRAGRAALSLKADLDIVSRERDTLSRAIEAHRRAITGAGDVVVLFGRSRARRKQKADRMLWRLLDEWNRP